MPRRTPQPDSEAVYAFLGESVFNVRNKRGLTQQELADRVHLTRTSITNIESGRQKILVHTLVSLSDALGVPVSELLPAPGLKSAMASASSLPPDQQAFVRMGVERVARGAKLRSRK